MSDSLQDQLLKLGLVKKADVNKASKARRKARKQNRQHKQPDESLILAEQARQAQIARDRDLNKKTMDRQRRRAADAEIRQLIESNEIAHDEAGVAFNFPHRRKIKQVKVDKQTHAGLAAGRVGIVRLDDRYRLVPSEVIARIRKREPNLFIFEPGATGTSSEDESYADYKVPDDLIW